jgi:hypothetical protein
MSYDDKHLYVIMHPNEALVASMLPPHEFGKHYTLGSSRYYHGVVIFAEIDVDYRHDSFPIDRYLEELIPKPDGSPKRSKFVSSYRVLEHIEFDAFKNLFVTSSIGKVLEIEKQPYTRTHQPGWIRTFQEICPLTMSALTYMTPQEFGTFVTEPGAPKSAPKVLFTQIDFNTDDFVARLREDPFVTSPIPNVHPHKLEEQIELLRKNPHKRIKGISLESNLNKLKLPQLKTGFWLAEGEELLFYPIPEIEQLEAEHYEWLRSLTQ